MHWLRGWSYTDHVTNHALITWLIMHCSRCYHSLITWLSCHWSRDWSYTDHVADHALIPWLSDFTLTFHFHILEKEMATHSSVLAWRIPGMGEPGGLPSMGSHRVGHDWSDLAAAAAWLLFILNFNKGVESSTKQMYCMSYTNFHGFVINWVLQI